jgi:hypothetical protein
MAEKGVMLADRPPLRLAPTLPPSFSGGGGGGASAASSYHVESGPSTASLGNYKGVMLCNRPDVMDGGRAGAGGGGGGGGGGAAAFTVASSHETFHPNGQNADLKVQMARRARRVRAPNPFIASVKAHLAELAARKAELTAAREAEEARVEEKRRKLTESQRVLRELIRNNVGSEDEAEGTARDGGKAAGAYSHAAAAASKKEGGKGGAGGAGKPAWARSEAAVAAAEADEEDELLAFADTLNFDHYVGDLEVRAWGGRGQLRRHACMPRLCAPRAAG